MKATLKFDLPEDDEMFEAAVRGLDYKIALLDFDNALRNVVKHCEDPVEAEQAQKWRQILWDIMETRGTKLFS